MTERYLVMPRGINVGTRNRVPMAELRSKLTGDGYCDVAGNGKEVPLPPLATNTTAA